MQHSGESARERWVSNIRTGLTVLFFVILPWQTRWIYRASPIHPDAEWGRLSLYASELLLGVFLLGALVRWVVVWRRGATQRQPFTRERWWLVGVLAVLLYGVLRSVLNYDPAAGFQHTWWILEAILVVIFLHTGWFPWRAAVRGLIIGLSLAAVFGIYQAMAQYVPGSTWFGVAEHRPEWGGSSVVETAETRFLRAYGPFPHPNIFGGAMAVGLFILWLTVVHKERMRGTLLATWLMSGALALSFSRGAWIAWVVALFLVMIEGKERTLSHVMLSVLTMGVVLGVLWPVTITRFDRTARLEARAIEERTMSITDGIAAWKRAPWFGFGPAQYTNTFFVQHSDTPWWQLAPPHHAGVALFGEYGVVGATLVIVTTLLFFGHLAKQGGYRALIWFAPLVVLMQFDHYLWSLYSGVMLVGLYAGFCAHFVHRLPTVDTHERS